MAPFAAIAGFADAICDFGDLQPGIHEGTDADPVHLFQSFNKLVIPVRHALGFAMQQ